MFFERKMLPRRLMMTGRLPVHKQGWHEKGKIEEQIIFLTDVLERILEQA
ncbi:hypothetical protein [Paenibacillus polymyxa]|nr:hypothetical protein [Paenibacillus polymyxa]MDQ0045820.1 hypothetical protein [Paenibacillus polymyxa]